MRTAPIVSAPSGRATTPHKFGWYICQPNHAQTGCKPLIVLVPQEGIEPPTHALRMRCSTPELLRLACDALRDGLARTVSPPSARSSPGKSDGAVRGAHLRYFPYTMSEPGGNLPRAEPGWTPLPTYPAGLRKERGEQVQPCAVTGPPKSDRRALTVRRRGAIPIRKVDVASLVAVASFSSCGKMSRLGHRPVTSVRA